MKHIHVECLPDEALIRQLGYSRKNITHHSGKSIVFKRLKLVKNELAMIDEDPGSVQTKYERSLKLLKEQEGLKQYSDSSGNIVVVLAGKLEDWIISVCKRSKIKISDFGLPDNSSELHNKINHRIVSFENLIQHLIKTNNKAIQSLKEFLQ
jgi:hypothetical protein